MILRGIGAALQELQAGFHRIKGYRGTSMLPSMKKALRDLLEDTPGGNAD